MTWSGPPSPGDSGEPTYPQYSSGPIYQPYPTPAPPPHLDPTAAVPTPRALRPIVVLLMTNLGLSVVLTIVTVVARHTIVNYQLDHRHITDPDTRRVLSNSYVVGIIGRVFGNVVVSIVYAFLVRALLRGRRWAYRRVVVLSIVGIFALLVLQTTPYPLWLRVEQLAQAVVLGLLLYFVTRPEVKAHFASGLPGRDVRRFHR